jgi:hypothetical protein
MISQAIGIGMLLMIILIIWVFTDPENNSTDKYISYNLKRFAVYEYKNGVWCYKYTDDLSNDLRESFTFAKFDQNKDRPIKVVRIGNQDTSSHSR